MESVKKYLQKVFKNNGLDVESKNIPNTIKRTSRTIKKRLPDILKWRNIQWTDTFLWRQTKNVWLSTKIKVKPC